MKRANSSAFCNLHNSVTTFSLSLPNGKLDQIWFLSGERQVLWELIPMSDLNDTLCAAE